MAYYSLLDDDTDFDTEDADDGLYYSTNTKKTYKVEDGTVVMTYKGYIGLKHLEDPRYVMWPKNVGDKIP